MKKSMQIPETSRWVKSSGSRLRWQGGLVLLALASAGLALSPGTKTQAATPTGDTFYGSGAGAGNTGDDNAAFGFNALHSSNSGSENTATGESALFHNTTGAFNTANGEAALTTNSTGSNNTAVGAQALYSNTGYSNTANGAFALYKNTNGGANTANGEAALFTNSTGNYNTANGAQALYSNTGDANTANGAFALYHNTGDNNTANGAQALYSNTGDANTANGVSALRSNTTGSNNTADGVSALLHNTTGGNNIALGRSAGSNLTAGSNNIEIGNVGVTGDSNTIKIGTAGTQKSTFIAGISGVGVSGAAVLVSSSGQLGVASSSARFKENIQPMEKTSEALLALKPVTFRYKKELDPEAIPQFGLIAEEVEKVDPKLVARDAEGKVFTVRYDAVNAMLLNEFLKEHRKVEELEGTLAQQKKDAESAVAELRNEIGTLRASVKEQAAQVNEVSAQRVVTTPAAQVAVAGR